jgi:hypothetical protein
VNVLPIPRAASTRVSDDAYDPWFARIRERVAVMLNGVFVADVIAYDCAEGWVRSLKYRDSRCGHPCLEVRQGIASEILQHGHVTVAWCAVARRR